MKTAAIKKYNSMTKAQIIHELKEFFDIRELVCKHVYNRWKEDSWRFIGKEELYTLLVIRRDILKVGMVVNDYMFGGRSQQRGLRCNLCQLVQDKTRRGQAYMTAHRYCPSDAVFGGHTGMTAHKARQLIKRNTHLLPVNIRLEAGVSWLHWDTVDMGVPVYEFKP